jgi:membrane fusion protein (multidrug efflux system)
MYLEFAKARVKARGGEDAEKVREDQREESIQLILADGSLFEEKGTFDFVNSQINPTTGSLLAQASFPNPDGILRPGLYAKVRVEIRVAEDAIVIPQRCLLELQGQFSVMVTDENNAIASRPVTIGQKMGDLVIIEEGLSSGEKVVIDALQKVRPGMTVQPVPTNFQSKTTL